MYKFSPTTTSFYPTAMLDDYRQAGTLPRDLVDASEAVYQEFSGRPPSGKQRGVVDGALAWVDTPPPSRDDCRLQAEFRKQRAAREAQEAIAPLQDAAELNMATDAEREKLLKWKEYRVLINRVDVMIAPDIDWPTAPDA
ncbi:tail fiber assembly protein [Serratia ficaria]|uniref:tail fiber assembly protein n=1 Tax=Serratia ficaria TaxID=61651 RepID=UPI002178D8FC|nr:tail fiber assembly protein [Serratia ficaria]CAI0899534.1 Caudovirales tail fibre assembly protein [Serratia ficaria]CAI2419602.1 Caudovirales tail fibre assembly protein [Serratia ficaria]CAI2433244.1 Caudovirales tail fibre assembly protein [Serratia ficaria]CAI2521007.1 Caudovirales tail fibre assembly protein [Serratia ficaria]